ncbi:MAG TPA: ABC transporter substrate-binding protein [Acidimicrobiales bacterium]|nr:ABC transporter substrate-binding protein [Acidimicrobiales bacterium]
MTARSKRHWWRVLAGLLALGLIAAACSGSDDSGGGDGPRGGSDATAEGDPDEGETPQRGGRLVYAREAETASPWTPAQMLCDTSCHQAIRGIYDTLTFVGEDMEPHPFLLESFEPNETYDEWTFTAREGITFHDGTPLNADALLDHFERMRNSTLVGNALQAITGVEKVDEMAIRISMETPWVNFPVYFAAQPGYIASPTWLADVDAGQAEADEPVGTGPFVFEEYNSGDNFLMSRNPDYWLEAPDGQPYPYLDEIEFVVQEEDATRARSLVSDEVDITHTDRGEDIVDFRERAENEELGLWEMTSRQGVGHALINTAADSPVADVEVRRAMAMAIDRPFLAQSRYDGQFEVANGPFSPGTMGYLEDTGFPEYDPEGARELVEEYEAENGPIVVSYRTTADPFNLGTVELIAQNLDEVGIEVEIDQTEQGEFIQQAVLGNFEVFTWRAHGGIDPETERVWWHSENADPIGEIALNFGRFQDDVIDENLQILRESTDEAERTEAAEAINRRFGEQVYDIWAVWTYWAMGFQPDVHGVQTPLRLPDGSNGLTEGIGANGAIGLPQLWVEQG